MAVLELSRKHNSTKWHITLTELPQKNSCKKNKGILQIMNYQKTQQYEITKGSTNS